MRTWKDLFRHLLIDHNRFLCRICAPSKKVFMGEHATLTTQELQVHLCTEHPADGAALTQYAELAGTATPDMRPWAVKLARVVQNGDYPNYPNGVRTPGGYYVRVYEPEALLQFRDFCQIKPVGDWDAKMADIANDTAAGRAADHAAALQSAAAAASPRRGGPAARGSRGTSRGGRVYVSRGRGGGPGRGAMANGGYRSATVEDDVGE
ncbi:hypothetical protein LTR53_009748 [Teratosphaeriaceae sp. CCFEE 6253]|nr:hypothetical protein LTR53_009748 [Teratosphaeriaceae sp. CCFEE 6253]